MPMPPRPSSASTWNFPICAGIAGMIVVDVSALARVSPSLQHENLRHRPGESPVLDHAERLTDPVEGRRHLRVGPARLAEVHGAKLHLDGAHELLGLLEEPL